MSAAEFGPPAVSPNERTFRGRPASTGFGRGVLYVAGGDVGDGEANPAQIRPSIFQAPHGAVIASHAITPAECAALDGRRPAGLALTGGSVNGHVAVMAQERAWPLLIGVEAAALRESGDALLDCVSGALTVRPSAESASAFDAARAAWLDQQTRDAAFLPQPARTADGERIQVSLAIDDLAQLRATDPAFADGVGLVRSEMLFMARHGPPGEEGQFATYRILLQWADGRPVAIRTLDPSGEKTPPGLAADGSHGVAWGLAHPEPFSAQLRALLRASAYGDLTIVLPMVESPGQVAAVRVLLDEAEADLRAKGRPVGTPRLGVMVETAPALANLPSFDVDSYAVGARDLAAALGAEDDPSGSPMLHEAVARVAAHARRQGRTATLCGTLAADPGLAALWIGLGLRGFCVPAAALGRIKAAIAAAHAAEGRSGA